jgi:hypothetical protein
MESCQPIKIMKDKKKKIYYPAGLYFSMVLEVINSKQSVRVRAFNLILCFVPSLQANGDCKRILCTFNWRLWQNGYKLHTEFHSQVGNAIS